MTGHLSNPASPGATRVVPRGQASRCARKPPSRRKPRSPGRLRAESMRALPATHALPPARMRYLQTRAGALLVTQGSAHRGRPPNVVRMYMSDLETPEGTAPGSQPCGCSTVLLQKDALTAAHTRAAACRARRAPLGRRRPPDARRAAESFPGQTNAARAKKGSRQTGAAGRRPGGHFILRPPPGAACTAAAPTPPTAPAALAAAPGPAASAHATVLELSPR